MIISTPTREILQLRINAILQHNRGRPADPTYKLVALSKLTVYYLKKKRRKKAFDIQSPRLKNLVW